MRPDGGGGLVSAPSVAAAGRLLSGPVVGWVLYDFAQTIFSFVVVTRYFTDWIVNERGQPDIYVGLMSAGVSLALVFSLPAIGARADRAGRHMPTLAAFTVLCATMTALLGIVEPVVLALLVAGVAIFAFNTADSQYHPLLAVVAPERRRGLVSGVGVAVGFIGTLVALLVLGALVADGESERAFLPTAAMFGVFALPCLLLVRERGRSPAEDRRARRRPLAELLAAVRRARGEPYGRLLLARFLYVDAIATALQFMTVYARRTGDFDGSQIDLLLAVSTVTALVGAVGAGLLAQRIGALPVILATLVVTVAALIAAAATGSSALLWIVGPAVGIALGSLSAVDRILMLALVPPERRGEEFGLYALVGKLSSGFGPLVLWGGTVLVATELAGLSRFDASRAAVAVLAVSAVAGLLVLRPLRGHRAA
jgi:UMF1 family MFS transporter